MYFSFFSHDSLRSQVDPLIEGGAGGVICPNAKMTVNTCEFEGSGKYFLTPDDLEMLVGHSEKIRAAQLGDVYPSLTIEEADKLRCWLQEYKVSRRAHGIEGDGDEAGDTAGASARVEDVNDQFIEATTKKCPKASCRNRESHYHGHDCHHVKQGCLSCRTQFCIRCLSTAKENKKKRGEEHNCKCGGWSSFCEPLRSTNAIAAYLVLEPYPHDSRCGCPICNECR